MDAYDFDAVKRCYDLTAKEYSTLFCNELDGKPFDRDVLLRFSRNIDPAGLVVEFAAGSGHIGAFLHGCGIADVLGTDISEEAVELARTRFPALTFECRNMLDSGFDDGSVSGIVCFYGIVHFTYEEIDRALREWKRILRPGGRALFSFHIGEDESLRVENFLDHPGANATWNFFSVDKVLGLMERNGIGYDEVIVRYPYTDREHPSRRCYIQFVKS